MHQYELPTQARLKELFDYDGETGELIWRVKPSRRIPAGTIAGGYDGYGYIKITVDGRCYFAHLLVWVWCKGVSPQSTVDHRDTNKSNNRIDNLREVTTAQNQHNRPAMYDRYITKRVLSNGDVRYQLQMQFPMSKTEEAAIQMRDAILTSLRDAKIIPEWFGVAAKETTDVCHIPE